MARPCSRGSASGELGIWSDRVGPWCREGLTTRAGGSGGGHAPGGRRENLVCSAGFWLK